MSAPGLARAGYRSARREGGPVIARTIPDPEKTHATP